MSRFFLIPCPFFNELKSYRLSFLRGDLIAALSVALLALPQAMAYAFVADLPPSAGIFAAIFGTIFTAGFSSSQVLVSGPSNTIAILIQSGVSDILSTYYPYLSGDQREVAALQVVLQIALVVGIFQILGGLLRFGRITQFASKSAILGYMTGAALAIIITQLYYFFGIPEMNGSHPLYVQGWYLLRHLFDLHLPTMLIGTSSLILLIFFHRFFEKIPGAVIVFFFSAALVALLHLSPKNIPGQLDIHAGERVQKVTLLEDFGSPYMKSPRFAFPGIDLRMLLKTLPLAIAITLLSALEATSIGRSYANTEESHYSDNQEVYGLGVSNFFSAFLGAMPSSGSFSRTALNAQTGARTRFAAMLSGVFLLIIVLLLGFFVTKIPLTALSALLLLTAYTMVNFEQLVTCIKATNIDASVVIVTICASLLLPLEVAFYIGVALSIGLYLKKAAIPYLVEYTFTNVGKLRPMEQGDARPDPRICIVQIEGELFFGAAEPLNLKIRQIAEDGTVRVVILQVMNARHLDASVCLALRQLDQYLKKTGRTLLISGATSEVLSVLEDAGLKKQMGVDHIFPANEQLPSEPTRNAYAFAKSLLT